MNFLFAWKYRYLVDRPIDDVKNDFAIITNRKWYDFSENITGRLNADNTFRVNSKWGFAYVRSSLNQSIVSINGRLKKQGDNTIIETTMRTNLVVVFFLYLIAILFFLELFGIKTTLEGPRIYLILFLPVMWLILFVIVYFSAITLQNRFERILEIKQ